MTDTRIMNHSVDGVAAGAIVGSLLGYLPAFAALAAIVWYAIQVYESKTVQKWVRVHRLKKRRARRLAGD